MALPLQLKKPVLRLQNLTFGILICAYLFVQPSISHSEELMGRIERQPLQWGDLLETNPQDVVIDHLFSLETGVIRKAAISPDGNFIAIATDEIVGMIDVEERRLRELPIQISDTERVAQIAQIAQIKFSDMGHHVVIIIDQRSHGGITDGGLPARALFLETRFPNQIIYETESIGIGPRIISFNDESKRATIKGLRYEGVRNLEVDLRRRKERVDDAPVTLTPTEQYLLDALPKLQKEFRDSRVQPLTFENDVISVELFSRAPLASFDLDRLGTLVHMRTGIKVGYHISDSDKLDVLSPNGQYGLMADRVSDSEADSTDHILQLIDTNTGWVAASHPIPGPVNRKLFFPDNRRYAINVGTYLHVYEIDALESEQSDPDQTAPLIGHRDIRTSPSQQLNGGGE